MLTPPECLLVTDPEKYDGLLKLSLDQRVTTAPLLAGAVTSWPACPDGCPAPRCVRDAHERGQYNNSPAPPRSLQVEVVRKLLAGEPRIGAPTPPFVLTLLFVRVRRGSRHAVRSAVIAQPSSCSDSCVCAGCASPWASPPTAPRRHSPSATSKTCSSARRRPSSTARATPRRTRSTYFWQSTPPAVAPRRFRSRPSSKGQMDSCTYAHTSIVSWSMSIIPIGSPGHNSHNVQTSATKASGF